MLLSSSNGNYPPFLLLSYFSVVVCLRCFLQPILLLIAYTFRVNPEFAFIIIVQCMMSANSRIILGSRSYSFVCTLHHIIIIIVQPILKTLILWNACQIYFVECVNKIKHIFSVIQYTIWGAVCFQFTDFPCDNGENIYTLCYYHNQIGSMNYYPLFRVRSWNSRMRWVSFYILIIRHQ